MTFSRFIKDIFARLFKGSVDRQDCSVIFTTALAILLTGFWTARQSGQAADRRMRSELVHQAVAVAATIDPSHLRALSFTADDKLRPEFQQLCSRMRAYAEAAGLSSLYIMALRNGQIVFGPESLTEGHPQASPPGTVYETPDPKDFELFKTGLSQIQGPRRDEYGTFVTASAPVFDHGSGTVLAAIGIDIEASVWQAEVRRAQWIPAAIALALVVILLISALIRQYRRDCSPQRHKRIWHAETVLSVVFFGLLTVVMTMHFHQDESEVRRSTFYSLAQAHAATCAEEFHDANSRLEQLVYFFESSQEVTREEFSGYCKSMIQDGILQACLWVPAVPGPDAASFVQTVRAAGFPEFFIWQKNKEGINEPASARSVYFPVLYIEPMKGHETGLGHDMSSEPLRNKAIQETLAAGWPAATDAIRLFALADSPSGIFVLQRVNASLQKGLVAFAIRPENLLGGAQHQNRKDLGLNICLFELQVGGPPLLMAGSSGQCGLSCLENPGSGMGMTFPIFRFGKAYVLHLVPSSVWLADHPLRHGLLAGVFGMLVTVLSCSVIALIANRRLYLEKQIERRTCELRVSEERYQHLVQRLETVREEERKRLSRELHDDIGQTFTALKIDLILMEGECTCRRIGKNRMSDMHQLLKEGIQSIHSLCRRLRPGVLDDLGLGEALKGLVDDWKQRNEADCALYADIDEAALSDDINTAVFRMVQEALTNVSRYAGASKVEINLVADDQTLNVSVADNGSGMEAGAENKPTSFGLLGMRERLEVLGGTLRIESNPGRGTRIEGCIPLPNGQGTNAV